MFKDYPLIKESKKSQMMAYNEGQIHSVDFPAPDNATRYFDFTKILGINQTICGMT